MYAYLRGIYKGRAPGNAEAVLLEVGGVGYEVQVPPIVEQELGGCAQDDPLLLWVSAQSTRDQPWPETLFGFLRPEERAFWELLRSIPRVGGKGAARAMAAPIASIAQAIQEGNRAFLDGLPGVTLEGADKMIASLRKKVGPFTQPLPAGGARRAPLASAQDELRGDAVELLIQMGIRRPDAQRAVDQLLASREDGGFVSVQELVTEYLRTHHAARS
jgi:Holliday junction DNA helicase RuvA